MRIAVARELVPGEARVALVPELVASYALPVTRSQCKPERALGPS